MTLGFLPSVVDDDWVSFLMVFVVFDNRLVVWDNDLVGMFVMWDNSVFLLLVVVDVFLVKVGQMDIMLVEVVFMDGVLVKVMLMKGVVVDVVFVDVIPEDCLLVFMGFMNSVFV